MPANVLRMTGICKGFPGVRALDEVDFDLVPGEIHGLVGENGAGKSTLMKILAGVYKADAGTISLHDEVVQIDSPLTAQRLGISIVHQEPLLFENLTVAENILVGREPVQTLDLVNRPEMYARTRQLLAEFETTIAPRTPVRNLSVAEQQIVEICKALSLKANILILDEPTSALSDREVDVLFATIRRLREQGIAIVYITHRLNEIVQLADRVSVLRDGRHVGTLEKHEISPDRMISMMVGRELANLYGSRTEEPPSHEQVFAAIDLCGQGFAHVDLAVRQGEIVGLTGLVGSGRSEVGLTIFGHQRASAGRMLLGSQPHQPRSTNQAIANGVAFVPEDRHSLGLFLSMEVRSNLSVASLKEVSSQNLIVRARETGLAKTLVTRLGIRTPSIEQQVFNLSGGNQQKTMLGKWLARSPKLLIVDEPTRGVDVGAKAEVYAILRQLAAQGIGILMISSEMPEVIGMCDRIYVMHEGSIMGELEAAQISEQYIMTLASGHPLAELQPG